MSSKKHIYQSILYCLLLTTVWSQELAYNKSISKSFHAAHGLAFEGDIIAAKGILETLDTKSTIDMEAGTLLARIHSWEGNYDEARKRFNRIISEDRQNAEAWISAVKNELYAKNEATALGLANKALFFLKHNPELERLRDLAISDIQNKDYPKLLEDEGIVIPLMPKKKNERTPASDIGVKSILGEPNAKDNEKTAEKSSEKRLPSNRIGISNSFTAYDDVYDPMFYSSISYRRKTLAGSIIPKINYSNRLNKQGLQYEFDFYPKFSKRFYAYLSYGYSNASIYPNHKVSGDLYTNLPGAIEFSAGMRYISFDTKNISVITNSLGHYRGNYYFSLRSYITPQRNNLTKVSGNLLVRKYFRDGENFLGINFGMGYSPLLRQLHDGDELLAETLLYVESQRLNLQYQFTPKQHPNIYMASLGVARQELSYGTGNFFWAVSAGISYQIKF